MRGRLVPGSSCILSAAVRARALALNRLTLDAAHHAFSHCAGLSATTGIGVVDFNWSKPLSTFFQSSGSLFVSIRAERSE